MNKDMTDWRAGRTQLGICEGESGTVLELFGHGTDDSFSQSIYGIYFYIDRYYASLKTIMMTTF